MTHSARQQAYLDAMGIERWVARVEPDALEMLDEPPAMPVHHSIPDEQVAVVNRTERSDIQQLDWQPLREAVTTCQQCELHAARTQTVFGVGNPQADWLIIGEAPGAEEDRRGEPFVGRAGQLLDAMLGSIGLDRQKAFIANILKCRPPNNRDPLPEEVTACEHYLLRQIALIQPKLILAVGRIAAQNLLKSNEPIGRLRDQVHHYGVSAIPVIVTYHPAYLLRSPQEKRKAWQDLLRARQLMRGIAE